MEKSNKMYVRSLHRKEQNILETNSEEIKMGTYHQLLLLSHLSRV